MLPPLDFIALTIRMITTKMSRRIKTRKRVPKKTIRRIPHHGNPLVHFVSMRKSPGLLEMG